MMLTTGRNCGAIHTRSRPAKAFHAKRFPDQRCLVSKYSFETDYAKSALQVFVLGTVVLW